MQKPTSIVRSSRGKKGAFYPYYNYYNIFQMWFTALQAHDPTCEHCVCVRARLIVRRRESICLVFDIAAYAM